MFGWTGELEYKSSFVRVLLHTYNVYNQSNLTSWRVWHTRCLECWKWRELLQRPQLPTGKSPHVLPSGPTYKQTHTSITEGTISQRCFVDNGVLNDRFDKLNQIVPVSQHTHLTVISTVSTHANIIPSNDSKDCFKNLLRFTQADKYFTHLNLNKSCDVRLTNKCGAQKIHKNELRKLWGCLFLLYVIFSHRVDYNKQNPSDNVPLMGSVQFMYIPYVL